MGIAGMSFAPLATFTAPVLIDDYDYFILLLANPGQARYSVDCSNAYVHVRARARVRCVVLFLMSCYLSEEALCTCSTSTVLK